MADIDLTDGEFDARIEHEDPWAGAPYHYVTGFREAIDALVDRFHATNRDPHAADTLIFPLGFLCRHLIELRLKELFRLMHRAEPERKHGLLDFWRQLRPMIMQRWASANRSTADRYKDLDDATLAELGITTRPEGTMDYFEAVVSAIDKIDPKSFSFRYSGEVPPGLKSLSLDRLAEVTLELDDFLDGLDTAIYEEDSTQLAAREEE